MYDTACLPFLPEIQVREESNTSNWIFLEVHKNKNSPAFDNYILGSDSIHGLVLGVLERPPGPVVPPTSCHFTVIATPFRSFLSRCGTNFLFKASS